MKLDPGKLDPGRRSRETARSRFTALYEEMRERICLLRYPPGMHLSETALAAEFGVSRTPLRRVLNRLEFEGLVESRHGVGTIVTSIDIAELKTVYALRMRLAELIGELDPVPPTAADLTDLDALHRRCLALRDERSAEEFARINMLFTLKLSGFIGNAPLREITERLYFQTARMWLQSEPGMDYWQEEVDAFAREIAEIATALRAGDMRAVGLIRRNHVSMSFLRLSRHHARVSDAATRKGQRPPSRPPAG
jgi:DNA-binding GntR family transcriptional regulator